MLQVAAPPPSPPILDPKVCKLSSEFRVSGCRLGSEGLAVRPWVSGLGHRVLAFGGKNKDKGSCRFRERKGLP